MSKRKLKNQVDHWKWLLLKRHPTKKCAVLLGVSERTIQRWKRML